MKVLLINYEYPPLGGGAGNATANIGREMARLGHAVTVLTSAFGSLPRDEQKDGVRVLRVRAFRRHLDRSSPSQMISFCASAMVAGSRLAAAWRPDASVAFFGIPSGPVGLFLKTTRGIPYIVSLRGGDVPGFQPYDLTWWHRLTSPVTRIVWRRASSVVANSVALQDLAVKFCGTIHVGLIPNGVDCQRFQPAVARGDGAANRQVRILFVGRLARQKGVDVLLRAVATVPPATRARLLISIVGDGPWRRDLEGLAQTLSIADGVHFLGWQDRDRLPECYRGADVFAFPSRDEGMSNTLLEAMACGLPSVVTDIPGNRELIQPDQEGLVVPPDDPRALADALCRLAEDGALRRRLGEAALVRIQGHFSWGQVAQAYLKLLEHPAG